MWRTRAVVSLLHEEIAGLPREAPEAGRTDGEALARARRRAVLVVALDWLALLVLVLFGERGWPALTLGPAESTAFTLALLAVAVHSGFRLGQLEKLRAVARAAARLSARDPES